MAYKPLAAGDLNTRIRIEAETRTPNGQGGYTTNWSKVATVMAKKIPLRGDEVTRDSLTRAVSSARFVIRFRSDVTPLHRLVEIAGGKIWNVRSVDDPFGRRDRVELNCESGVAT